MNVNDMVAAMAAKTVDAMVNVEPYNAIAEADGLAIKIMNYWDIDKMPVFMAATPDFVAKSARHGRCLPAGLARRGARLQGQPEARSPTRSTRSTPRRAITMSPDTFEKALATVDVNPGFPSDLRPYMQQQAEILLKEKKIAAIPDWDKALRPEFMEKARAMG